MTTRIYRGQRTEGGCTVTVDGQPLDPRHDLGSLAAGFEWGYDGTGPRQLALAILADHFGAAEAALARYQTFTRAVIETLDAESWTLSGDDIERSFASFSQVPMTLAELLAKVRGER